MKYETRKLTTPKPKQGKGKSEDSLQNTSRKILKYSKWEYWTTWSEGIRIIAELTTGVHATDLSSLVIAEFYSFYKGL